MSSGFHQRPAFALRIVLALLGFSLALGACSGAGPGRVVDPGEAGAELVVALAPALSELIPAQSPKTGYRFATTSAQVPWRSLQVNVFDLETGEQVEPDSASLAGDTLHLVGPFAGKRLALRITNGGDLVTRTTAGDNNKEIVLRALIGPKGEPAYLGTLPEGQSLKGDDDWPDKRSLVFVIGELPAGAGRTVVAPPAGVAEFLASQALLEGWGGDLRLAAMRALYAPDSPAHPVRKGAADLKRAVAAGKFDSTFKDLSLNDVDEAVRFLARRFLQPTDAGGSISYSEIASAIADMAETPAIAGLVPNEVAAGDLAAREIKLAGAGFGDDPAKLAVMAGEFSCTVVSAEDANVMFRVDDPAAVPGTYLVTLALDGGDPVCSPVALTIVP